MFTHHGLPPILTNAALTTRYNPLQVTRWAWLAERWWWAQASASYRRAVVQAVATRHWRDPEWVQIATVALPTILRVGSWGAKRLSAWANAHRGQRKAPAALRTVRMAAPRMSLTLDLQEIAWAQLDGETYDQYKDRVFTPLRESVYGVPYGFADQYAATRIPPIVDATQQLQRRVGEIMTQSQLEGWTDKQLEDALAQAGQWPLMRVRNQIRTETSTMYNAGRWQFMARDVTVTAYRYVATLDLRTTAFCRAINGVVVAQADVQAIPPFHYSCRTIMEPLFAWEQAATEPAAAIPVPGEGNFSNAPYKGFGQQDLVSRFRSGTG